MTAIKLHTSVDTSGVGVPDISPDIGEGLAGRDVDELDVGHDGNTLLVVDQVRADVLAKDVERANLALGVEDGASVVSEDELLGVGKV